MPPAAPGPRISMRAAAGRPAGAGAAGSPRGAHCGPRSPPRGTICSLSMHHLLVWAVAGATGGGGIKERVRLCPGGGGGALHPTPLHPRAAQKGPRDHPVGLHRSLCKAPRARARNSPPRPPSPRVAGDAGAGIPPARRPEPPGSPESLFNPVSRAAA